MMGADNLRKVAGYDFHHLRNKDDVRTMWGDLDPQWRLLQSQLETKGPGWYSPAELKERLFTNKSKRPGDDTKDALHTDGISEHHLAVMSTRPTFGFSRRKGDLSCHVCSNRRGRTSHFSSIYSHSA